MIKKTVVLITSLTLALFVGIGPTAHAADSGSKCGDTQTQLIACDSKTGTGTIGDLISIAISVLTVGIGIVATGGLAYAGIVYASARDDQAKVNEAKSLIRNILIGVVLYILTIAVVNWLLPGGVVSGGGSSDDTTGTQQTTPPPSTVDSGTVTPGTSTTTQ